MKIFGTLEPEKHDELLDKLTNLVDQEVLRRAPARSAVSHPQSTDLELAIKSQLEDADFEHHVRLEHPRTGEGFEYDFWRSRDGIAVEVMGYRADDEIYKDILKFHVHEETRIGVVFVPRYKWKSSRKTEINYTATMKALSFANHSMSVDTLVAVAYDWDAGASINTWKLKFPETQATNSPASI